MRGRDGVVVIGAGPAGIAAAVQLRRFGQEVTVIEKDRIGGLLTWASLVENYPGFPGGISGADLASVFEEHLRISGANILFETVVGLDAADNGPVITTDSRTLNPGRVVVASGTSPVELSRPELSPWLEGVISYDIRPLRNERGKRFLVLGAGDAAFDYALSLGANNDVIIVNRGKRTRCLPLLRQRACQFSSIVYYDSTSVTRVTDLGPSGFGIECSRLGERFSLQVHHVIAAIGRKPRLDFLPDSSTASLDGPNWQGRVCLAGDVRGGRCRQVAIAVGDGMMAAMQIGLRLSMSDEEQVVD